MRALDSMRNITKSIEPWWTIIGAPVIQEFFFRFIPYTYAYLPFARFWLIGITSAVLFALIHWYFGKLFLAYSFLWGLILWLVMDSYGFSAVVLVHVVLNILHIQFGVIRLDKTLPGQNS